MGKLVDFQVETSQKQAAARLTHRTVIKSIWIGVAIAVAMVIVILSRM